jgi:glycosyltransferase involved in cell wall biosynthesis
VFALPSRCEPFGLVFLEAMVFGLPCIGTRRDAMPEIIEDGITGYLVETGDEATLADRLVHLLQDRNLAKRMGEAGHARVMSRFQWSHVAERMDRRLEQVRRSGG